MRDLNLIVIGDICCGTTRAYLTYLKEAGIRPKELWLVDFVPADNRVRQLRKLPAIGSWLGNVRHRQLSIPEFQHPELYFELCERFQSCVPHPISFFGDFEYEAYVERVRYLVAEDYDDPYLQSMMKRHAQSAYLYTNGGIVPAAVLSHPSIRVFHVHPGIVPEVRGSDCFLWSLHRRGRPGASCFYMAPGIDEGDVLARTEFDLPDISFLNPYLRMEDEDTVCRAIAHAFDPHMRALLFANMLSGLEGADARELVGEPQVAGESFAYLWMHPNLRLNVLKQAVEASRENTTDVLRLRQI
jgi:hypothetical protein